MENKQKVYRFSPGRRIERIMPIAAAIMKLKVEGNH